MKIITIVPIAKGIPRDELSYFSAKPITAGTLVTAPFGNRLIKGVVVDHQDVRELKSSIKEQSFRLRNIITIHTDSILAPSLFYATQKTSSYFCAPAGAILETMIPGPLFTYYSSHPIAPTERVITHSNIQALQVPFEDRISTYKTLIRENLAKFSSTLIIVPSQIHAEILSEKLGTGINDKLSVLHSKKTKKYITEKISEIISSKTPLVVIATAPYSSLTRPDWDTVIIEDASSSYYRYTFGPHFDMRYFIEQFAKYLGARLIYGATLLDVELHHRLQTRELFDMRMTWHIKKPEDFQVVDMKEKEVVVPGAVIPQKSPIIHKSVLERIQKDESPESLFLFVTTRKGLAPITSCADCGTIVACSECGSPLVLHRKKGGAADARIYMCHHCMHTTEPIDHCLTCTSWKLTPLGISTEVVAATLRDHVDPDSVMICDGDKSPAQITQVITTWKKTKRGILVVTPAILPYIDHASFGCLVSMDSLLSLPTYKGSETGMHAALLFLEKITTTAIIQTRSIQHEVIRAIRDDNSYEFIRNELATRTQFNYPPHGILIKITFTVALDAIKEASTVFETMFAPYHPDILIKRSEKNTDRSIVVIIKTSTTEWNSLEALHQMVRELGRDALVEINPDGIL